MTRLTSLLLAALLLSATLTSAMAATTDPARTDSPDGDAPILRYDVLPEALVGLTPEPAPGTYAGGSSVSLLQTGSDPEGDNAMAVVYTPDGNTIVVAHVDSANLVLHDGATGAATSAIALSGSPNDVAVSSDGLYAVTANIWEDTASIVDLGSGTEIAVVPVGDQPGIVVITPDGTTAVVGNGVDQSLSVIDIASATETFRIPGAGFVSSLSLTPENGAISTVYSSIACVDDATVIQPSFYTDEILFFDISTGSLSSLPCDNQPRGLALSADGSTAVVVHTGNTRVLTVVDTGTAAITKTIATGIDLWGPVSLRHDGSRAVCAVQNACVVIDLATDSVSSTINTASVNDLVNTADGNHALIVGYTGSLVSYDTQSLVTQLNNLVSTSHGGASPVGSRAAITANHFGEDLLVLDTNGIFGTLIYQGPSGSAPEADRTRKLAVSADGTRAVTSNILSDTATILDLTTGAVEAIVAVGNRPADVAISPDGSTAVVANLDSTFTSVINLSTHAVTHVPTGYRNGEVEISPDGQFAYTAVVASGDGVWRIDLNTLATSGGKLLTGNMGSTSYLFQQVSDLRLSHDGATLVTCDTFSNTITLVDTASWSVAATVPVGARPSEALFSADDSTLYVANRDAGTLSVVDVAAGTLTGTIAVGTWPYEMALSADESTLWVLNYSDKTVGVVDTGSGTMTSTIGLPNSPAGLHFDAASDRLWASTGTYSVSFGPGPLVSINLTGELSVFDAASGALVEQVDTGLPPAMLVASPDGSAAFVPSPLGDGVSRIGFADAWEDLGNGLAGSFGVPLLLGNGPLTGGSANSFDVSGALTGAPAYLVVGVTLLNAPFKSGVMVPDPDIILGGLSINGTGALHIPFVWPLGVPAGVQLFVQVWIEDAAGPVGFAATNGVVGTTP